MNVLSLFNGFSGGKLALETLGVEVGKYYSSEIDKYANQATQAMFPDTIQLGSVTDWREWDIDWSSIDLVTGGFPCQAWSMAGKQLGDKDERGMLFWVMLDIMKHVKHYNPDADFLIENVKMKKEFEQYITTHTENALGHVHKILINSALVSAQNRNRYYWTSFAVGQPEDKGILLKDIVEHDCEAVNSDGWHKWWSLNGEFQQRKKYSQVCNDKDKAITMTARQYASWNGNFISCGSMIGRKINPETGKRDDYNPGLKTVQRLEIRGDEKTGTLTTVQKDNYVVTTMRVDTASDIKGHDYNKRVYSGDGKCPTLAASSGGNLEPKISINKSDDECIKNVNYRKLTPRECFRLQTVPEHHIDTLLNAGISNTQLYKMCGNGWTIDVIAHIFKSMLD